MRHCNTCNVDVATPDRLCPLCCGPLIGEAEGSTAAYPPARVRHYPFARRLLLFLSVVAVAVCAFVNYMFTPQFWWWLLALTVLVYVWIAVPHSMRRGGNGGGKILMQVVCAVAVCVLLDLQLGWQRWSVNFMLPVILCAGIISIVILILCNRTSWAGYVLYQVVLAAFGFVPLVLYATGVCRTLWPAVIPGLLAIISLAGLLVFGDRSIKNEFRRRLHF